MDGEKARVVNIYHDDFDIYCGRGHGSIWGNPFKIGLDGGREEVILKYEAWIRKRPYLISQLHTLKGLRLGCHCAPKRCHCEVLIKLMKEMGIE